MPSPNRRTRPSPAPPTAGGALRGFLGSSKSKPRLSEEFVELQPSPHLDVAQLEVSHGTDKVGRDCQSSDESAELQLSPHLDVSQAQVARCTDNTALAENEECPSTDAGSFHGSSAASLVPVHADRGPRQAIGSITSNTTNNIITYNAPSYSNKTHHSEQNHRTNTQSITSHTTGDGGLTSPEVNDYHHLDADNLPDHVDQSNIQFSTLTVTLSWMAFYVDKLARLITCIWSLFPLRIRRNIVPAIVALALLVLAMTTLWYYVWGQYQDSPLAQFLLGPLYSGFFYMTTFTSGVTRMLNRDHSASIPSAKVPALSPSSRSIQITVQELINSKDALHLIDMNALTIDTLRQEADISTLVLDRISSSIHKWQEATKHWAIVQQDFDMKLKEFLATSNIREQQLRLVLEGAAPSAVGIASRTSTLFWLRGDWGIPGSKGPRAAFTEYLDAYHLEVGELRKSVRSQVSRMEFIMQDKSFGLRLSRDILCELEGELKQKRPGEQGHVAMAETHCIDARSLFKNGIEGLSRLKSLARTVTEWDEFLDNTKHGLEKDPSLSVCCDNVPTVVGGWVKFLEKNWTV